MRRKNKSEREQPTTVPQAAKERGARAAGEERLPASTQPRLSRSRDRLGPPAPAAASAQEGPRLVPPPHSFAVTAALRPSRPPRAAPRLPFTSPCPALVLTTGVVLAEFAMSPLAGHSPSRTPPTTAAAAERRHPPPPAGNGRAQAGSLPSPLSPPHGPAPLPAHSPTRRWTGKARQPPSPAARPYTAALGLQPPAACSARFAPLYSECRAAARAASERGRPSEGGSAKGRETERDVGRLAFLLPPSWCHVRRGRDASRGGKRSRVTHRHRRLREHFRFAIQRLTAAGELWPLEHLRSFVRRSSFMKLLNWEYGRGG